MDNESEKKTQRSRGDILTDYAIEKAREYGITLVRSEIPKNYVGVIFSRRPLHMPTTPSPTEDTSGPPEKDSSEEKR